MSAPRTEELSMKKIFVILFIILILLFTVNIHAAGKGTGYGESEDFNRILKKVSPSIVKVISENHKYYFATGIAIDKDLVISNREVTPRHYNRIFVRTVDGKEYDAKLKAVDPSSSVILLKLGEKALKPIKRGKGGKVGEWIAVVGAFYGEFPAIYRGLVSVSNPVRMLVNAPAVPGVSGGAVVNDNGELVAVVRGRFSYAIQPDYRYVGPDAEVVIQSSRAGRGDMTYALPAEKVFRISEDLKLYGHVRRGWFGINLERVHSHVAIEQVVKDSPAYLAGIRPGDVILKIDGEPVKNPFDVEIISDSLKPEQKVKIELVREDAEKTVEVVMGEAKARTYAYKFKVGTTGVGSNVDPVTVPDLPRSMPLMENYVFSFVGSKSLGVDVMALNEELAKEFNVKKGSGVMVSRVHSDSAAQKAGLRVSDVIVKVGDDDIAKTSDLRKALNRIPDNSKAQLVFYRKGKLMKVAVEPDEGGRFGNVLQQFTDKMKDIHLQIDNERVVRVEDSNRARNRAVKASDSTQVKSRENVEAVIKEMKKQQELLKKQLQELEKRLEQEKSKEKEKQDKDKKTRTKKETKV